MAAILATKVLKLPAAAITPVLSAPVMNAPDHYSPLGGVEIERPTAQNNACGHWRKMFKHRHFSPNTTIFMFENCKMPAFSSVLSVPLCFQKTGSSNATRGSTNRMELKHRGTEDTEPMVSLSEMWQNIKRF